MKKATKEKIFTKYYLQDYSASLIFEKLGIIYPQYKTHLANSRMRQWRIKLGLPARGVGYKPKYHRPSNKVKEELKVKRAKKRLQKLPAMIQRARTKILLWQEETGRLEAELSLA